MRARSLPVLLLLLMWSLSALLSLHNRRGREGSSGETFTPLGRLIRTFSLGNEELAADLLMAKAAVGYGRRREGRGRAPLSFGDSFDTVVEVDPFNEEAYLIGARLLSDNEPERAVTLLKKGAKRLPRSWRVPELAGSLLAWRVGEPLEGAELYGIASSRPGAPLYIPSLASRLYREGGEITLALEILERFSLSRGDRTLFRGRIGALRREEELFRLSRSAERGLLPLAGVGDFGEGSAEFLPERLLDFLFQEGQTLILERVGPPYRIAFTSSGPLLWAGLRKELINTRILSAGLGRSLPLSLQERVLEPLFRETEEKAKVEGRGFWGIERVGELDGSASLPKFPWLGRVRVNPWRVERLGDGRFRLLLPRGELRIECFDERVCEILSGPLRKGSIILTGWFREGSCLFVGCPGQVLLSEEGE